MAQAAHAHDTHGEHHAAPPAEADAGAGWFAALVLMILTTAFLLLALLLPRPEMTASPRPLVRAVAAEPGPLGPTVERTLAGGARIAVPERGVEGRLLAFVLDPTRVPDKTTWFDFDRLTFETGSATLAASSNDQLTSVAAILAAHPAVTLKIGGYTDNVGDPAFNQRLSEQRAGNVRAMLVQLGVAPARLEAEGYGEQFPVGDNATPEGRAMNRRISMRVMAK